MAKKEAYDLYDAIRKLSNDNFIVPEEISDSNTALYRFLSLPSLMQIIEMKSTNFANITSWEDPGELFGQKISWQNGDKVEMVEDYFNYYGQCWTNIKETDAMWRIYSSDKQGVCIKTSINRMEKAISKINPNELFFLYPIIYGEEKNYPLTTLFNSESNDHIKKLLGSSIYKRTEFKHENEVRIMFIRKDDKAEKFLNVDVDYETLIDEVYVHPLAKPYYVDIVKSYLSNRSIECFQSSLYDLKGYKITGENN